MAASVMQGKHGSWPQGGGGGKKRSDSGCILSEICTLGTLPPHWPAS